MKTLLLILMLSGCAQVNKLTKENLNEFCSHSKEHRDLVLLGLTDDMFEPHSIQINCNCEYGVKCNE